MKVFTQPGDYRYTRNSFKKGSENTLSEENIEPGWTLVYDSNVNLKADRMVDIRVKDGQEVFIPQWEVQSFLIYCNRGMLVAPGRSRNEGVTYSENEDIEVREGVKSKKPFTKYTGYAQLMGKVRYYVK